MLQVTPERLKRFWTLAQGRSRRVILASGANIAQRVVLIAVSFVMLPMVLHHLGLAGFGIWAAATSLAWLSNMLDLGLGSALVTLIPRSLAHGRAGEARDYVGAALLGGAVLAGLFLAAGFIVFQLPFAHAPSPPFLAAGIAILLNIPLGIAGEIWSGLQKAYAWAAWQVVQAVLTLALLALVARAGGGVSAMVAVCYGAMLSVNAAGLVHALVQHPELRPGFGFSAAAMRVVLTQGGQMFCITIAAYLAFALDNALTLLWLGPAASALMAVAMRVCTTATSLVGGVTQPFWPGFADAVALRDRGWVRRAMWSGLLACTCLTLAGSALLVAIGAPVLHWWLHADLAVTPALLCAMAAWIILTTLIHMPGLLMNATQQLRPQIFLLGAAAAAGFFLKYAAARAFGVVGILWVYPLLCLFWLVPGYYYFAWRWLAPRQARHLASGVGT